ncbi:DUF3237 domain-containing protein [Thalassotalea psychrophila]|uniref:DUF3237 domain-containing protein n=1 Tax=Thalassotalea psychrophila TaxID=3065647 RepID=A0ABY9TSY4_9GAMM|nr:DUF3237 domain-containing protein [Colwelliaceae bacterium SQ149]
MLRLMFVSFTLIVITIYDVQNVFAKSPSAPTLEYVMSYQANLAPAQKVDENRFIFNVTSGWLTTTDGSTGKLINPCGDWLEVLPNGSRMLDVRCTIRMDDNSLIYIKYTGRTKLYKTGAEKREKGQATSGTDAYFITSPTFHTTSEKYMWMNDAVFINKWVETGANVSYVKYDVYIVKP